MVKVRKHRKGWFQVGIRLRLPDGTRYRERVKAPVQARAAAQRWGEAREREIFLTGPRPQEKEVPTLEQFVPRFIEGYAVANRQKPSEIRTKETHLNGHLLPALGRRRLDAITTEDVQAIKTRLQDRSAKTINNVLSVLGKLLKVAVEWQVIERLPCALRLLPAPPGTSSFHDFDELESLIEAAGADGPRAELIVLLGAEAGLRAGEMMALEWSDVDFNRGQLRISRSEWRGKIRGGPREAYVTVPKGGRGRVVPMTARLAAALKAHRHLRGPRVLYLDSGRSASRDWIERVVARVARKANLANDGVHVLRHTFCSHLAMKGVPARTIQALAGHADLGTTMRYMHLSPAAIEDGIRALEGRAPAYGRGNEVATASGAATKSR